MLQYLAVCTDTSYLEVSSGFRNPSCRGFNRQNVEKTGGIQCSPIWGITGLFFCCLKISYEMAGSHSDVIKCLWLGSPQFHHADLMEQGSLETKANRQRQNKCTVYSLSSQGGSVSQSWLKLNKEIFYFSKTERLTHMILNHFQSTAAHAVHQMQTYGWYLNPSPQLLNDEIYIHVSLLISQGPLCLVWEIIITSSFI